MPIIARAWLTLALVLALAAYGGAGDLVRPLLTLGIAIALLLTAFAVRRHLHLPPLAWIAVLFLPLVVLTLVQVLPFGWHHPWVGEDSAVLGVTPVTWSIDPAASTATLVWLATLAGLALTACLLARGDRVRVLVEVLVYVAAVTAVLGLCLALTDAPWPSVNNTTLARGPFIYPNHAAAFWAACLPLATLTAHRRGSLVRWGAVAVLALAILLSGSRGGILVAAVVMLPLSFTLLPRRRRWWWAGGGALVVAAWLWVIGISDVTDKFTRLRGDEGLTLNGRVIMWQAALPVIIDAGALGSGANTTIPAYRRSGDTHFADVLVNHLHSDPLEWWLEYGWLGLLVGIAAVGATLVWLRPHATTWQDPGRRVLLIGAGAGLLILTLHSCGDFTWHNPAVAMTGVLLLCVLALAGHQPQRTETSRARTQLVCGLAALLLLLGAWRVWDWHASEIRARDVERLAATRQAAGLTVTGTEAVARALAMTPGSVRLAAIHAWLAHASGDLAKAEAACAAAALLAPGDPAAWSQRALLARSTGDVKRMSVALRRALAWAPTWPDIQQVALRLVAEQQAAKHLGKITADDLLPHEQTAAIVSALLTSNRAQPPWFFLLAHDVLGEAPLLAALRDAGPALAASAEPWLAERGPVDAWLALQRRITPVPARRPAPLALFADRVLGPDAWQPVVPVDQEERRALADTLNTVGLPVPPALRATLERDGPLWERWARPVDLLDERTRVELAGLLRSELHRGWARLWADRLSLTTRALAGDSAMITRDCPPMVLARLAGVAPYHDAALPLDDTLRHRARLLLERWRDWEWQDLPGGGRWTWWYGDGRNQALIENPRWTLLVVDGEIRGWLRGQQDIAPLLGHGLRRVVLLEP